MTEANQTQATVNGLQAIDAEIIATTGGTPGSGLYTLLNMLAGQFMGVPRSAMPTPKAPPPIGRQITDEPNEGEVEAEDDDGPSPAKPRARHR